jgi:L-lactate dehydrogenase complex protein LldE
MASMTDPVSSPKVLLLPTCLVDALRPSVGFATLELLRGAGCEVSVSARITCCGQPAYNSGERSLAQRFAQIVIAECEPFDYVVLPSGSCGGMLRRHYPLLFAGDANWHGRAERVAAKTFELTAFLHDVRGFAPRAASFARTVTYHDSCSSLREMGVRSQPRQLLGHVEALTIKELPGAEVCCGFGGTFCLKFPDISNRMVADKCAAVAASGANVVLGADLGCLMNIAGKLARLGSPIEVRHVAEVLAGKLATPPLCKDSSSAP